MASLPLVLPVRAQIISVLCERGGSPASIASGALREGGALPINTAGGLMSEANMHGLNRVTEGVRQMAAQR